VETEATETVATEALAPANDSQPSNEQELLLMKEQLLRALADTENMRKRSQREIEDASKYAVSSFARDMVTVLENLHRTLQNITAEARAENPALNVLAEGVEMTERELSQAFARHHIRRIDPHGEKFDHNFHQAVAQVESQETPAGHVVHVMQAGYVIHDRLLRPAMVAVSKGTPAVINTEA
jgi:molecular chaperone GrpE